MSTTEQAARPLLPPRLLRFFRMIALLRESPIAMTGVGIILFWVVVAVFAPLLAPFDPNATLQPFARPGTAYAAGHGTFWLGSDNLGRYILSRIVWGSRTVLFYGFVATACAYALGILMGLAAGYYRGWLDEVLSRIGDIILSFPILVLYVVIIATIGASGINIVLAVTFASAPGLMRIVRGLVLEIRARAYVAAADRKSQGGGAKIRGWQGSGRGG